MTDFSLEKTLPYNLDAERAYLGAALLECAMPAEAELGYFYLEGHRRILSAMKRLSDRNEPINIISVKSELSIHGELEAAGGAVYLVSLTDGLPRIELAPQYLRMIKRDAALRSLIKMGGEVMALGYDGSIEPEELVTKAMELCDSVSEMTDDTGGPKHISDILQATYTEIEQRSNSKITGAYPTGYTDLDKMLSGGIRPQNLFTIAGRPGSGKSSVSVNMLLNQGAKGIPCILFSIEMGESEIMERMLCCEAMVDFGKIRTGYISREDWIKINQAAGRISQYPIWIDDSTDIAVSDIRIRIRRLKKEIALAYVDYLQLLKPPASMRKNADDTAQITAISKGLKFMAKSMNIGVVALSQLSRASEKRTNRRPQLSDLRGSGCLSGETLISMGNGDRVKIRELSGKKDFQVWSINQATLKVEIATVSNAFCTGSKPIFTIKSAVGRSIDATQNHKFLTIYGWKSLDEIVIGEWIALPRRIPTTKKEATMSDSELGLLGQLIGNGCFLPGHSIQYTTQYIDLATIVARYAFEIFRGEIKIVINPERTWIQVYLSSKRKHTHGVYGAVREWLEDFSIFGKRSYEKVIPGKVFLQPEAPICFFLRNLWATDGHIGIHRSNKANRMEPSICYSSSSEKLAHDVQSLLLRVGINAIVRSCRQKLGRDCWSVNVSGKLDIEQFILKIGSVGAHQNTQLNVIKSHFEMIDGNTNRDIIPLSIVSGFVGPAAKGVSNYSRKRAMELAIKCNNTQLQEFSGNDIYWDRVKSITKSGVTDVYDLTVPGNECFIAGDIIVHNSIEQDSDLVMFVHREEVSNPTEENQGAAEFIVGKHRNGPCGDINMGYLKHYTKFVERWEE